MNSKISTSLLILLSISACGKEKNTPPINHLSGKWNWISSSGGFSGGTVTPTSVGYTKTLEIISPNSYIIRKNNVVIDQGMLTVGFAQCVHTGDTTLQLILEDNPFPASTFIFKGSDTLVLEEECADCYKNIYVRTP